MKTAVVVMISLVLANGIAHGQVKKETRVSLDGLATSESPPEGYQVRRLDDIVQNGKVVAHKLLLMKDGTASKVSITIEKTERKTQAQRVAAFKGYVNGTAELFRSAGLKLTDKSIPDTEKADFSQRQIAELTYALNDGGKLLVQLQVFFTDEGHNIVVIATNEQDLALLAKWASSVKPK